MGLFDWFKKKDSNSRQETGGENQERRSISESDKETYKEIVKLIAENTAVAPNMEECLDTTRLYFDKNAERYDERGVDADEAEDTIIWLAIADELIQSGEAVELDWKTGLEDFVYQMKVIADKNNLKLSSDWFDEEEDIPAWCKILDKKWAEQGFCVGAMDIDSDSYVMFVCKTETLEELATLGKKVNHRFDCASNM